MARRINVLSLFDGMSCAQIALDQLGFGCNYFASELDKYAIAVTQHNYPNTIQIGDIRNVSYARGFRDALMWKGETHLFPHMEHIDLVIGGSPCQGFSVAGLGMHFDDPRSGLFYEYVRLIKEIKPKHFILENVKMKPEWRDIISHHMGVQPVFINSSLVSAQYRQRYYWCNVPVEQPKDRDLKLRDILESGYTDREKSYCIDANYFKGGSAENYFKKKRRQLVFSKKIPMRQSENRLMVYDLAPAPQALKERRSEEAKKLRSEHLKKYGKDFSPRRMKEITTRDDHKANTVMTAQDISSHIYTGMTVRKLTPLECERLQTVPEGYTQWGNFDGKVKKISNTQRYKMLGNGFTVEVIKHILNHMNILKRSV